MESYTQRQGTHCLCNSEQMLQSTEDTLQLYTNIQPSALSRACGGQETAIAGKFHKKIHKRMTNTHRGRGTTTERTQQIYAYT